MPVRRGISNGKPFFQWGYGEKTKKYFYTSGSAYSRERAKQKAALQGRAIKAQQNSH